ncbi:hypothetical protein [Pseudomonas mohnii]
MLCEYFRYIDLEQVYEQLEDFRSFTGPGLANIQWQFWDTLSSHFEDMAEAVFDEYGDEAWKKVPAIQVAAEIGDNIESDLEKIATVAEITLPSRRSTGKTVIEKITILSIHATFGDFDYWQKSSLLIYQYDFLCWLYSKDRISEAFQIYELILRTQSELAASYALSVSSISQTEQVSNLARERANKRHAPTNKVKADLITEWDKTSTEYRSRADFCRIVSQREGLLYRTVYDWIARHDRSKT